MVRTLAEEERVNLKAIALELKEIRKLIDELAEALVKMSDKDFKKIFGENQSTLKECQVDKYKEKLEQQLDAVEKEF
jgi:hypothetical protein